MILNINNLKYRAELLSYQLLARKLSYASKAPENLRISNVNAIVYFYTLTSTMIYSVVRNIVSVFWASAQNAVAVLYTVVYVCHVGRLAICCW
jgi:hypothetical protein